MGGVVKEGLEESFGVGFRERLVAGLVELDLGFLVDSQAEWGQTRKVAYGSDS